MHNDTIAALVGELQERLEVEQEAWERAIGAHCKEQDNEQLRDACERACGVVRGIEVAIHTLENSYT